MGSTYIKLHEVMSRRGDVGLEIYVLRGTSYYKYRPFQVWRQPKTGQSGKSYFLNLSRQSGGIDSLVKRAMTWVEEHDPASHAMLSAWSDGIE